MPVRDSAEFRNRESPLFPLRLQPSARWPHTDALQRKYLRSKSPDLLKDVVTVRSWRKLANGCQQLRRHLFQLLQFRRPHFPFAFGRRVEGSFKSRALCMTEAVERSSDFAIESALTFSSAKSFRRRISSSVHVRPFARLISSPSAPARQAGG